MSDLRKIMDKLQTITNEDVVPFDASKARKPGSSMSKYAQYKNSDNVVELPKPKKEEPGISDDVTPTAREPDYRDQDLDTSDPANMIPMAKEHGFFFTSKNMANTDFMFLSDGGGVDHKRKHVRVEVGKIKDMTVFADNITGRHWRDLDTLFTEINKKLKHSKKRKTR